MGKSRTKLVYREQHKSFVLVHKHLKKAKKRQVKYANQNSEYTEVQIGNPVYLKQQQRKSKLEGRWCPYYRIIEQTSPVSFKLKNQLGGSVTKAHAEHIRLANVGDWEIPKDKKGRPKRRVKYVDPLSDSSDAGDNELSDIKEPLSKLAKKYKSERETSSDEDNIPVMELAKRMREPEVNVGSYPSTGHKSVNEVSGQKEVKGSEVKNLLQAIIGIL